MFQVELPWPPAELSPNTPGHWRKKAAPKAHYKSDCFYLAKQVKNGKTPAGNLPVSIKFCPPCKTRRDLDNLLASIKAGLDGVCQAWGIDDSRFRPITIDFGDPVKHGKVLVTVQRMNEGSV